MVSPEPPAWLVYPGARVRLTLTRARDRDCLAVIGNPQGLASLSGFFLWLTAFSDHGSLSVSGLPFVAPEGPLALATVMELESDASQGRLVRLDKDQQFEWQVYDDDLQAVALQLHLIATHPDHIDYVEPRLSSESAARLVFEVSREKP